jgi:HK97 family phage major capsid protein
VAYDNIISRTDAAALIPEDVSASMRTNLASTSAARELFTNVPVGRAQVRFPVLSALPVAYFVTGDTGLKQTTEAGWDNKYLNIEEIACIVPIPESVVADSDEPIWGEVQPLMEQAIGRTLDAAVFFGTNKPSSWPTAVVTAAVAAGNVYARGTNDADAGGVAQDISETLATLESDGYDANGAAAIRSIRGRLRGARDANGNQLPEVNQNSVYGLDVTYPMRGLWPTGASAAELIVLDRSEFVIGIRQDITFKLLDQAVIQDNTGAIMYNLPQQDMVAMRVVFRVGWQVANTINYDQAVEANRYPAAVMRSPAG